MKAPLYVRMRANEFRDTISAAIGLEMIYRLGIRAGIPEETVQRHVNMISRIALTAGRDTSSLGVMVEQYERRTANPDSRLVKESTRPFGRDYFGRLAAQVERVREGKAEISDKSLGLLAEEALDGGELRHACGRPFNYRNKGTSKYGRAPNSSRNL